MITFSVAVTVETHKIYPIGMDARGDALCAEVQSHGYVNWFRWYAEFDYDFDEYGRLPDERPTLRDLPLLESGWDDDPGREERRAADPAAPPAAA